MTVPYPSVNEAPATFRFTFDEFERMFDEGLLQRASGRVELLDGEILEMSPQSVRQNDLAVTLTLLLSEAVQSLNAAGADLKVAAGATLGIGTASAPEPDVFVTRTRAGEKYHQASDALLVIEVSVSTRLDDLKIKRPLYAGAGIPEFWIVEPEVKQVRIYRDPQADGTWRLETVVIEGTISPLFADTVCIKLADLF